jgi:hypothetical protein
MTKGFKSPNIHNVWLKGRYTSISVEPDFWEQFRLIVIERRTTAIFWLKLSARCAYCRTRAKAAIARSH